MKPEFPGDRGAEKQATSKEPARVPLRVRTCGLRGCGWAAALLMFSGAGVAGAQPSSASLQDRIAAALVASNGGPTGAARKWDRETALELKGMADAWYNSANGEDYRFVKQAVDSYVEGVLAPTNPAAPSADMGDAALLIYRVTLKSNFYDAANLSRQIAEAHCGISSNSSAGRAAGSACDEAPFLAEYALVFQDPGAFGSITDALVRWDKTNRQVHDKTARAREAKAIVDALENYPDGDAGRAVLIQMLSRIATEEGAAPGRVDEKGSGTIENECLLVYALMKGARLGYLPEEALLRAKHLWTAMRYGVIQQDASGKVELDQNTGVVLIAAAEAEHAETAWKAHGKVALIDGWFNSQERKNAAGQTELFHYKWNDEADSGYALLGHMLRGYGMATRTLPTAPTAENLRGVDYYFIASPDIPVKNPNPHYVTETDAAAVAEWVKHGGVLVMMENDPPNADIDHLNLLADRFGIHFDNVLHHHILGEQVEDGTIPVKPGGPLFHHAHTLYMKDTCAISLRGPSEALLRDRGDVVMAAVKYGRGTVFAAVDPWLYNEYTDGRKNPKIYGQFDNFGGGTEFVRWLVEQRPQPGAGVEGHKETQP